MYLQNRFCSDYRSLHRRSDFNDESTMREGKKLLQDLVATETFNNLQELFDKRRANVGEQMNLFCPTGKEAEKLFGLFGDHKVILSKMGEYGFDMAVFNSSMMSTYKLWCTSSKILPKLFSLKRQSTSLKVFDQFN